MEQAAKRPSHPLGIVLLTIIIGVGLFAVYLHRQGNIIGTVIIDFYRNWGLVLLLLVAVVNLFSGGPGEKDQRAERILRWSLLILINWGVWNHYGG